MIGRFVKCSNGVRPRLQHLPLGCATWFTTSCPQPSRSCGPLKDRSGGVSGPKKFSEQFAYLMPYARHVTLGFYHGGDLADPEGLLPDTGGKQAEGTLSMRSMKIATAEQITQPALRAPIEAAATDKAARSNREIRGQRRGQTA